MILRKKKPTHTRKINPKLGALGILGLLGLLGFLPQVCRMGDVMAVPFPFFFFSFFGFFGFYYEGKMSNTLIDERFEANSYRATAIGNQVGLSMILLVAIVSISVFRIESAYVMLSLLLATIGLAFGVALFLQQYLLYKFENEA